jgi:hypothetical protein
MKMMYNRCMGIFKFGKNTYPWRMKCRSNLGHIFWPKKCILWAGKYGIYSVFYNTQHSYAARVTSFSLFMGHHLTYTCKNK